MIQSAELERKHAARQFKETYIHLKKLSIGADDSETHAEEVKWLPSASFFSKAISTHNDPLIDDYEELLPDLFRAR